MLRFFRRVIGTEAVKCDQVLGKIRCKSKCDQIKANMSKSDQILNKCVQIPSKITITFSLFLKLIKLYKALNKGNPDVFVDHVHPQKLGLAGSLYIHCNYAFILNIRSLCTKRINAFVVTIQRYTLQYSDEKITNMAKKKYLLKVLSEYLMKEK